MAAPATAGGAEAAEAEASAPSWDTPAARELRAKIKSLEREARKRETVLQVTGWEGLAKEVGSPLPSVLFVFGGQRGGRGGGME